MKKLRLLFIVILTMVTGVTVSASRQTNQDATRKIVINKKGGIYDQGGTKLGYIDKNDIVRNNEGKELYFIDKNGNVISSDGKKLGMAKKNGSYYNVNGENVLNTKDLDKERCAILDPKGYELGNAYKNYKLHACAAHCFWLEQEKAKKEKAKMK